MTAANRAFGNNKGCSVSNTRELVAVQKTGLINKYVVEVI